MARSLPKDALPTRPASGWTLTLPRVGTVPLLPPLLLALLTLLALTLAYSVRPTVQVDMGTDADILYVRNFNAREVDASASGESLTWQQGQPTLAIPGRREGVWIATFEAAPGLPDDVLEQAAIAVNGERVGMPRRTARTVTAVIPPEVARTAVWEVTTVPPLVNEAEPPPDLIGSVTLAPARTYRWSRDDSSILFPNLGHGAWTVDLTVVAAHPNQQPVNAQVLANGVPLLTIPDTPQERRLHMLVPASAMGSGSLELRLTSNTYNDGRPLGVFVSEVQLAPAGGASLGAALPPWGALGLGLVAVLGMYGALTLALGRLEIRDWNRKAKDRSSNLQSPLALLSIVSVIALGAWALVVFRFPFSFMLPGMAGLMIWSMLLLLVLRPFIMWFFRFSGIPGFEEPGDKRTVRFVSLLLLIFLLGYWLKAGGALFPYFVGHDVQWHMDRSRWILEGQLPLLYSTNSPLNESTMPTAEWGANRPVIPYSPYYHMFATVFALPIFPSMAWGANQWSMLLDGLRVPLMALLALKLGLSRPVTLWSVALYSVLPVGFLIHNWGNVPTGFGLWLTLLCMVFMVAAWEKLEQRGPMIAFSLMLTVTFLIYTVTAVFQGVFLVFFSIIVWLAARQGPEWRALLPKLRAIWTAAGVAILVVLVIYYGQYILPIIERTLPYFGTVFTQGAASVGVERPPFSAYMYSFWLALDYKIWPGRYLFYGLFLPLIYTIPALLVLWKRPLAATVLAAWYSVAVLFMFAGYRISMVDKQLFYILPLISISWAIFAQRYWHRGRWGQTFVILTLLLNLAAAMDQWIFRIAVSPAIQG